MRVRSYVIPLLYLEFLMFFFKIISILSRSIVGCDMLSSYSLLVSPLISIALISFFNDFCVYKICNSHNLKYDIRLLALASSGVMLTFGIPSFSNTLEMALCSALILIVSECMI